MPSPAKVWIRKVNLHVEELDQTDLTERHVQETRRVCREAGKLLMEEGLACTPYRFGDRQFDHLFYGPWRRVTSDRPGLAPQTVKYNFCLLGKFLRRFNNLTVERRLAKVRIPTFQVRPTTAPTEEEANRVFAEAKRLGIEAGAFVAFELVGLRRSSVLRLRVGEFHDDFSWAEVWVKNKGGERKELIRVPEYVRQLLPELLAHRAQVVADAIGEDDGHLFVHLVGGRVATWSKAYVDRNWVLPAFKRAGVVTPGSKNHGLRRATATALSDRGVPIEKVARQLHQLDTKTTLKYVRNARLDLESNSKVLEDAFGKGAARASEGS